MRFVRWPVGSSANLVVLQIPSAFVEFAGGCSLYDPASSNSECRTPFSVTAPLLRAMLPDLSPVPQRRLTAEEARRVVRIKIDSVFAGRERSIADSLQVSATTRLDMFAVELGSKLGIRLWRQELLIYKDPRFGLDRIGLQHNEPSYEASGLHDFLYLPPPGGRPDPLTCPEFQQPVAWPKLPSLIRICSAWAEASDFLVCADGAAPDEIPPPRARIASCQQWFGDDRLSAVVTVDYRRQHLSQWQDIKRDVLSLVRSFMPAAR